MRNALIAAAVVAAGAIGYFAWTATDSRIDMPELAYVPADTALLSVQIKPIDIPTYLATVGMMPAESVSKTRANLEQARSELAIDEAQPAGFAFSLFDQFLSALEQPEQFSELTGLSAKSRSLIYMVGIAPVMRLQVSDEAQFWAMFDAAEQDSGYSHQQDTLEGQSYRRYALVTESNDEVQIDLLVRVEGSWATLTLDSSSLTAEGLRTRLALSEPADNLRATNKVGELIDYYDLHTDAVGYLSSAVIAAAFTDPESNRLGRDLNKISKGELVADRSDWQTPACQQDMAGITERWPGLVFDASIEQNAAGGARVSSNLLLPTSDKEAIANLQGLRGFIPSSLNGKFTDAIAYLALGSDIGQLAPNMSKLWVGVADAEYSCLPLVHMQQEMKQRNPLAALAVTTMGHGLQGAALILNELDLAALQAGNATAGLDAVVSLAASDIEAVYNVIQASLPSLMNTKLPEVGEATDITQTVVMLGGVPGQYHLRRGENQLLIHTQGRAESQAMTIAAEPLTKNGIFAVGLNYEKLFAMLAEAMAASGEELPDELAGIMTWDMNLAFTVDVKDHGLIMTTEMQVNNP
ncbi:hypothetical protein IDSA_03570 [Pseudidiomarina salinarum]|uniref:DUF3352 domain-containing protein n=1 Tax=Pseudidiomarina salinarum TaxID=435908 RepID=A0A094LA99_9GAMM|nr:hypothetical protein [Pseudidiomarina salinarum]KFZ31778.1 hypothetical protein IDSA_03570 [Pseudidiomarina salinarum]RUO70450.1 hypothetical protein CWI79_03020 [Pseudidiomarina salinarum]